MFKFLNINPEIFGIDINDLSLRLAKIRKKGRGFELVSFNEVHIPPGIVKEGIIQDGEMLAKTIQSAIKTVKGKRIDTKYAVVALPEEKSFSQVIQMPQMTNIELRNAIRFEAENYIPLPIDSVYLDFQRIDEHKEISRHQDVLINVMAKSIVDSYVLSLKKAGVVPCILENESQAIARAFVKNKSPMVPTIFIDFGKTKTGLVIYSGTSIRFTVTLSVSSEQLTQAIAQKLSIDDDEAEKLKIRYGLEKQSNSLSGKVVDSMIPIVDTLATQIKKYIDFYHGHAYQEYFEADGTVERVILCGGGANLRLLPEYLSKALKIPVELGDPFANILRSNNGFFPYKKALSFVTAIGAALRGAGDTYLNSYSDNL